MQIQNENGRFLLLMTVRTLPKSHTVWIKEPGNWSLTTLVSPKNCAGKVLDKSLYVLLWTRLGMRI